MSEPTKNYAQRNIEYDIILFLHETAFDYVSFFMMFNTLICTFVCLITILELSAQSHVLFCSYYVVVMIDSCDRHYKVLTLF